MQRYIFPAAAAAAHQGREWDGSMASWNINFGLEQLTSFPLKRFPGLSQGVVQSIEERKAYK